MKKAIKRIGLTLAVLLTLGGVFAGGAYANELYRTWADTGAKDYVTTDSNLDKMRGYWDTLVLTGKTKDTTIEGLNKTVTELNNTIASKGTEIANLKIEVKRLTDLTAQQATDGEIVTEKLRSTQADLEQAIKDMNALKGKSNEVLDKMEQDLGLPQG